MQNFRQLVTHSKGYTLVEALIAITLLAILVFTAVPYSISWGDYAKISETESILILGYGRARALALRNPLGVIGGTPAASLKLENDTLLVCEGTHSSAGCSDGGGSVTWSYDLPDGVSISINSGAMSGYGLDNTGQSVNGSGTPTTLTYSITRGDEGFTDVLR